MRLLYFDSFRRPTSADFSRKTIPPYAILSHTWGDDEFLFEDLVNGTGKSKAGYEKIMFCGEQATRDSLQYFWVDTCCIDKWKITELSHAINSMFRWYKNAAKCYAFLSDVSAPTPDAQLHQDTWEASFRKSRWFTRGWTLQELLAPASIDFFSLEGQRIGDRASLEQQICEITRIPVTALRGDGLDQFSVPERMSWMAGRQTKEEEDMAYSLIGLVAVSMEFRYGEGKERAFNRLQEEIGKANTTPFLVPFNQNARFIGRTLQLAELERKLFVGTSATKVAITGPGGIGKTQLALALAYRIRQECKNCSVFWISARDKASIHQGYAHIARRLAIPGWDDEKTDVKKLVQLYLSKETSGQWLLVLDGVDEATIGSARLSNVVGLMEFLPSSKQGAIVFTTADKKTATKLAPHDIVELPGLEEDIAQRMLEMCLVEPAEEQEEASLLIKELAYLPLAIVQAAAYINVNKTTLQGYLSLLVERKKELAEDHYRESGVVIAATWLISFEQIRRHDDLAADYLLFMACVDRNDIPLALLPTARPHEHGIHAVATLDSYSLVTKRTAESALDLHRLVHVSTRIWLQEHKMLSQWTEVVITRLLEVFPDSKHGSRSKWRRLLPHAKSALSSDLTEQDNEARTNLAWKCAMALLTDGRWREAEELFVQVMEKRKRVLGNEHPSTLTTMGNLATVLANQGKYEAAEVMNKQTLSLSKTVLGREHPETLMTMSNLATVLDSQGKYEAAEAMNRQTLSLKETVLGHEHPSTLTTMSNLATTLSLSKTVLGHEHPSTLMTMSNLASVLGRQGKYEAAEAMIRQTLSLKETVLGREHPDTLMSVYCLAHLLANRHYIHESLGLYERACAAYPTVLGNDHPTTRACRQHYSEALASQRWE
ncbi:kinesin light chain [Paraphaeosphaeria sporulosa]|uniref:Kinesin light chain n=1 Tax=Paraphaeosphaeria sporulosa TaxID=1460663 RepID=A0A177C7T9_9PLEO|nr:kinesin light chain [Paraphaeosphaeria sporulosa]OAG03713.1 kinesin light chain [Paraphaeosphaeria sporulosa]